MPNIGSNLPQVAIVRCARYDEAEVARAVEEAVESIGGIRRFVAKGEKILLKPNLLSPEPPEKAVTTHPEMVRAMIRLVRSAGGTPIIGDTPAGRTSERILRTLAETTGMMKVCREEGAEFVLLLDSTRFPYQEGTVARSFELAAVLRDVDGVISLPKLKTHTFTMYTGAVKNLFGLVPGLKKAEYHLRMQDPRAFSEMLVDLAEFVRPRLTVMDAVVGMHGDGPSGGEPIELGLVFASENPHALDAVALDTIGAQEHAVWTVERAKQLGLIPKEPPFARVVGSGVGESFRPKGFRMPAGGAGGWFALLLSRVAGEAVVRKPQFLANTCILCGACIASCPAKALSKGEKRPRIDRSLCIRCYCCQEVCTHKAVRLRRMPLRSFARGIAQKLGRYRTRRPQ